jgi:two-component system, chemotaxis family, chemotaxis protein CheY
MAIKVLVVEDSPTMRQLITFALRPLKDCEIVEATDGLDGLKKINEQIFSIALVDINMPLMDGLKLVRLIKEDPRNRQIPVVIISTEGGEVVKERALALGVSAYITKPIKAANVLQTVRSLLGPTAS